MAGKGTSKPAPSRADAGAKGSPPSPRLRLRLSTIDDVKSELARLYREAKAGKRDVQDASRLGNMLAIMARMIEGSDYEKRLAALEASRAKERTR